MNITICENLKKLRKEKGNTQEELAEHLGISMQAVSKWERGEGYPDITLIPALALYYNVTSDELLGMTDVAINAKIDEYCEKFNKLNHIGDMKACIDIMREALAEYPRNFKLMMNLAHALFSNDNNKDEVINICERVLENCTEDNLRQGAIQLLCFTYPHVGKRDRAIELAKKMPTMCLCSGMLLEHIYERGSEDQVKTLQWNIQEHIDWIRLDLDMLAKQENLTLDEKILCYETSNKLYEAIYYDGNLLFYHNRLAWNYYYLGKYQMKKDKDTTIKHLFMAEKHAVAYDEIAERELPYTSIFVNKCIHSPSGTSKNWIGTECGQLFGRLNEECFVSLHDNPEFIALKERLMERQKSM
ncbi:MAG: helix-turn-helix domain-containing protein [Oscillospiraceae bacterium]|nr:helix-turn-helix domain-containing protein [Oscillospiraceae bacterium]